MPDGTDLRVPRNANHIMLWDPVEVRFWCAKFRCSERNLRQAVRAVGESATAVETWFQKQGIVQQTANDRGNG